MTKQPFDSIAKRLPTHGWLVVDNSGEVKGLYKVKQSHIPDGWSQSFVNILRV